jgi:pSer/pThr/pTyr-binding forkhead associated (FHA) protein
MATRCDDTFDPSQPTLIVTYGNTAKKHRALNRPVLVLGRARGCDIGLMAPDVSNVHCVIVRHPEGFFLRDCSSRSGTRLNGDPIREAILHDGDVLQIGPFSFQAYLPASKQNGGTVFCSLERAQKLERSRRNLARHALSLRRQLQAQGNGSAELAAQQLELDRRVNQLRQQARDVEQKAKRLQQGEHDLSRERETLERERAALQAQAQQGERDQGRDRETLDRELAALKARLQQGERDRQALDLELTGLKARLQQSASDLSRERETLERERAALKARLQQGERDLSHDRQTLDRELAALKARLQQSEGELSGDRETLERERAVLQARIQQGERDLAQRRAQVEAEIRLRWNQFQQQLREEEEKRQQETASARASDLEAQQGLEIRGKELAHFSRHLARYCQRLHDQEEQHKQGEPHKQAPQQLVHNLQQLRQESSKLRELLAERDRSARSSARSDTVHDDANGRELDAARKTIADLAQALAEKDRLIEQLRQKPKTGAAQYSLQGTGDHYDDEMNRVRRQRESERQASARTDKLTQVAPALKV